MAVWWLCVAVCGRSRREPWALPKTAQDGLETRTRRAQAKAKSFLDCLVWLLPSGSVWTWTPWADARELPELAWIKRITSELPWGLAPACTCQPVPSEVALGHTKIAHASHRTPQDRHKAEPRALRARPRLLETGSRLAQDSSRHTQDRAKIVQEPPTQPKTAEDKSQASPRHAKKALGAPEDSPRWAQDTPKTSSSKGQELLGLPGQWLLPSGS